MIPYKTTRSVSGADLLWLLAAVVVSGVVVGLVASMIGRFFRPPVIFPLAVGALVGLAGSVVIYWRRFNAVWLATVFAVIGGLTAFVAEHAGDYLYDRQVIKAEMMRVLASLGGDTDALARKHNLPGAMNRAFADLEQNNRIDPLQALGLFGEPAGAQPGAVAAFRGWLGHRMRHGPTIVEPSGRVRKAGRLGGAVFWVSTALLICCASTMWFRMTASDPLCPECGDWLEPRAGLLPVTNAGLEEETKKALSNHDAAELARRFPKRGLHVRCLALNFLSCPKCKNADHCVELLEMNTKRKKWSMRKLLLRGLLPADAAKAMAEAVDTAYRHQREEAIREVVRPQHRN